MAVTLEANGIKLSDQLLHHRKRLSPDVLVFRTKCRVRNLLRMLEKSVLTYNLPITHSISSGFERQVSDLQANLKRLRRDVAAASAVTKREREEALLSARYFLEQVRSTAKVINEGGESLTFAL